MTKEQLIAMGLTEEQANQVLAGYGDVVPKSDLEDLQRQHKTDKLDWEAKTKGMQLKSALKLALTGKVHDMDLVASLIDNEKIELDEDGNVKKGLDEQITALQEAKSFLFTADAEEKPTLPQGTKPGEGASTDKDGNPNDNYGKKIAEAQAGATQLLTDARKAYFD
ncbi:phage scaffolding protein [Bacillus ndiopicus]|uniref:phage scaffolding protein n=1 Tax=Bacillus ndiopicus TaxID=1347368 RepID=UPI0005A9B08E|nr:phage scaffolding protein [Bacillus ndiopicus]